MSRQEKPKVGVDMETVHACLGNRSSNLVKRREMRFEGNSEDRLVIRTISPAIQFKSMKREVISKIC